MTTIILHDDVNDTLSADETIIMKSVTSSHDSAYFQISYHTKL